MEKTCCFTGHRDIPEDRMCDVKKRLADAVETLISEGYTAFIAGGALGFDTMAALAVLDARERKPEIVLHLVLPCPEQTKMWRADQVLKYREILERANSHEYVSQHYTRWCMAQRNRKMVEMSSAVIACYDGSGKGGTAMTVGFAEKKGIRIINVF